MRLAGVDQHFGHRAALRFELAGRLALSTGLRKVSMSSAGWQRVVLSAHRQSLRSVRIDVLVHRDDPLGV